MLSLTERNSRKCQFGNGVADLPRVEQSWELWSLDVWGNQSDGFEVNDRCCLCRDLKVTSTPVRYNVGTEREFVCDAPSDDEIKRAIVDAGYWNGRYRLDSDGTGDENSSYLEDANGRPIFQVERNTD